LKQPDPANAHNDAAAVAASYLASFSTGDRRAVAAHVSDDFQNRHTSALGQPSNGRAQYLQRLKDFLATFEGLSYEVEEIISDGERVAAAYVMRARVDAIPVVIPGVMRFRVRHGLIEQRTDYFDSLTFLQQTGRVPPPGDA